MAYRPYFLLSTSVLGAFNQRVGPGYHQTSPKTLHVTGPHPFQITPKKWYRTVRVIYSVITVRKTVLKKYNRTMP